MIKRNYNSWGIDKSKFGSGNDLASSRFYRPFKAHDSREVILEERGAIQGVCPQFAGYALIFSLGGFA